ncbi:MAG: AAA family ATPase [Pseudomonadota bacterium]
MENFVVISGCSGGGKSTLLKALKRLGHGVVEEPGRRIVKSETENGGSALPWVDPVAFSRRAVRVALQDRAAARHESGWIFFDRSLIDAASALQTMTEKPYLTRLGERHRYHKTVFLAPPWPEIYRKDLERRHGFEEAHAEYERLCRAFPDLGYEVYVLPKVNPLDRAHFILEICSRSLSA